jgi:hypothetical protein
LLRRHAALWKNCALAHSDMNDIFIIINKGLYSKAVRIAAAVRSRQILMELPKDISYIQMVHNDVR